MPSSMKRPKLSGLLHCRLQLLQSLLLAVCLAATQHKALDLRDNFALPTRIPER